MWSRQSIILNFSLVTTEFSSLNTNHTHTPPRVLLWVRLLLLWLLDNHTRFGAKRCSDQRSLLCDCKTLLGARVLKGQSVLKPSVSSRPNVTRFRPPRGRALRGRRGHERFARTLQALPGQWLDPKTARAFPPCNAIQAPQGPSVTGAGNARGQRGRPPARAGNLVYQRVL